MRLTSLLAALAAYLVAAAPAAAQSIDETINRIFADYTGWYVGFIFAPLPGTNFSWIALWLVVGALVFTFYFGFIQLKGFWHSIKLVKGDYSDPNDAGEVSHFQALATALSGTVGLGNIAGVAVAVSIGGPGATFWMVVAGLFGMATKFTECTLGVKYRNEYPDGTVSGGPMYYITKGFKERGLPGGPILAVLFCIFTILGALGGGNMFQANQAHAQIAGVVGDFPGYITGFVLAAVTFMVIVGGLKSIASVTEKVVPFMGIFYVVVSIIILIINWDMIGWAFGQIFLGVDRLHRAFRLAQRAVDALLGVDGEEVRPFVEAVDRAHLDAIGVLALDAVLGHHVGHGRPPAPAGRGSIGIRRARRFGPVGEPLLCGLGRIRAKRAARVSVLGRSACNRSRNSCFPWPEWVPASCRRPRPIRRKCCRSSTSP